MKTPNILSEDESRTFWVSWESGSLSVGRGFVFDENAILKWKVEKKTRITFIGFASTWREQADFRLVYHLSVLVFVETFFNTNDSFIVLF